MPQRVQRAQQCGRVVMVCGAAQIGHRSLQAIVRYHTATKVQPAATLRNIIGAAVTSIEALSALCLLKVKGKAQPALVACGCYQLSSLEGVQGCNELEELRIPSTPVTRLEALSALRQLKKLWVNNCMELRSLEDVRGCSYLETLQAYGTCVTGFEALSSLCQLKLLGVSRCWEVYSFNCVQGCSQLQELRISSGVTGVTSDLKALSTLLANSQNCLLANAVSYLAWRACRGDWG